MNLWDSVFPVDEEIVIWGAGKIGREWFVFLDEIGRQVKFFIDSNTELNYVMCNDSMVEVVRPKEQEIKGKIILISPLNHEEEIYEKAKGLHAKYIILGNALRFFPKEKYIDSNILWTIPGHFYSPYPTIEDIREKYDNVIENETSGYGIDGIDLNDRFQCELLKQMNELFESLPDWPNYGCEDNKYRFRNGNPSIGTSDIQVLHFMLRLFKPHKLIEVGSGYTSAATLDTNEFFLNNEVELEFIEPYPNLLRTLIKSTDNITLLESMLQDVPLEKFTALKDGDILFIDSTHVSKFQSDVNYLFFHILPSLDKGVIVHLHDIFYPWEYSKRWLENRICWNELYVLRAFLQNNSEWEVLFFNHYMAYEHKDLYHPKWQLLNDLGGGSFWMRKKR